METPQTNGLIAEIADDLPVIRKAIQAYKTDGAKGLAAVMPEVAAELREDVAAVQAALPEIKAGYKTTEFWLVVGVGAAATAYTAFSGKDLPVATTALVGSLSAVYVVIRSFIKRG